MLGTGGRSSRRGALPQEERLGRSLALAAGRRASGKPVKNPVGDGVPGLRRLLRNNGGQLPRDGAGKNDSRPLFWGQDPS